MHIYDIIIIGGGISGLYLAYQLIESRKYNDILLIESSSVLGGRIRTEKIDNYPIELGAARFSDQHTNLISLLYDFGLKDKMIELPTEITRIYKNKKINYNLNKILKKLYDKMNEYSQEYLEKITLFQYSVEIIGYEESKKLQEMFGYDAEFLKLKAYSALTMFEKDLLDNDTTYYVLQDGLSQLINKLESYCNQSGSVKIQKNVLVKDIQDKKLKVEINNQSDIIRGLKIISTIPYLAIRKMDIFDDFEYIHCVKPIPLIRIYAQYPKDKQTNKVWFHKIKRTITDNYIRHIIPIDYEKGIIMISYTDLYLADMWNNWYLLGEKILTEKLHTEIQKILKVNPPTPLNYKVYYWKDGVHMWRTRYSMDQTYSKLLKPFPEKEIYLANESFSKHQCWIEGSLLMVKDVLKRLGIQIKKLSYQSQPNKLIKDTHKKKRLTHKKKRNKIGGERTYSLDEVLKNKTWIIFEHDNQKWIYEIQKDWFSNHPGGGDKLREGIQANQYYKEGSGLTQSPTDLFKSIGAHSNIFQDYIVKNNHKDKIKLIGLLK